MELTFANPSAFLVLFSIPLLVGLKIWGNLRARRTAGKFAAPRLLDRLLTHFGRGRAWLVFLLEIAALGFFTAALARPQYGFLEEETQGTGRSLIIAMDTSKSMLANDLEPNRLTRAKLAAMDLVHKLRGDRIGLMPFAGTSYMYVPITPDTDALIDSIDSLDADIIPRGGSNIGKAIDLALETLQQSDLSGQQAMIIFTDGEELEGEAIVAAQKAREAKVAIITVAVGTQKGGVIPDNTAQGGYFRDRNGRVVMSRLQKEVLLKIANITSGLYLSIDGKGVSDSRLDLILQKLNRSAMKGKITKKALDRYRWPLSAGLICLLAAFLAGIVHRLRPKGPAAGMVASPNMQTAISLFVIVSLFIPYGHTAETSPVEKPAPISGDPWKFYREGDYENALYNFDLALAASQTGEEVIDRMELARGVAAFKSKEHDIAVDAFGAALTSDDLKIRENAHYNLANAIYERTKLQGTKIKKLSVRYLDTTIRQMENSLEHYQETLVLNSGNKDAKTNHDRLAEFIKKLKETRDAQAQKEGAGKEGDGKKGKKKGKGKGKNKGQGQGKGNGQGQGEGQGEGDGDGDGDGQGQGPNGEEEEGEGKGGEEEREGSGEGEGDEGSGGKGEGETDEEKAAREKSNEDHSGKLGSGGQGGDPSEESPDESREGTEETNDTASVNGATGYSRGQALDTLRQLSDEDLKAHPQIEKGKETRPAKDW